MPSHRRTSSSSGKAYGRIGRSSCRIYADRPYVCRTQGLPLRWLAEDADGEVVEQRDICPLNEAGEPLELLAADDCWTLGEVEARLAALQAAQDGGARRRVALRSLFRRSCDSASGARSEAKPSEGPLG